MEIIVQKIDRQEIQLLFIQDVEDQIDDISPLISSLTKLKKIVNKPGFKNDFDKEERGLWNKIFKDLIPEEPIQGFQYGGGDRVLIQD